MTMTIDSNSVLLVCVASAGQYKVFEHVQNVCVPSTHNLHSCLCALRACRYRVCRTTYVLYSSRFSPYTTLFVHVHFRRIECESDSIKKKRTESSFTIFVLYVKGSRMIHTVIRTGNRTHTYSYLLDTYLFVCIIVYIIFI